MKLMAIRIKLFLNIKIRFEADFLYSLNEQVRCVSMDKSSLAKKFKKDSLKTSKKIWHIHFKKSIYFKDENIRDDVF